MGQVPARTFNMPTPFGQAADPSVVTKALQAPKAPLNSFLPLNPGAATASSATTSAQNQAVSNPLMPNFKGIRPYIPT